MQKSKPIPGHKIPTGVWLARNPRHILPHRGTAFFEVQAHNPNCHLPELPSAGTFTKLFSFPPKSDRWQMAISFLLSFLHFPLNVWCIGIIWLPLPIERCYLIIMTQEIKNRWTDLLTRLRCYSFISAGGNPFLSCCKDKHYLIIFQILEPLFMVFEGKRRHFCHPNTIFIHLFNNKVPIYK